MRAVLFLLATSIAVSACAEDRLGRAPTPAERSAANGLAAQLVALESVTQRAQHVNTLLTAVDAMPVVALLSPAGTPAVLPRKQVWESLGSCVTDSDTTATYRDCALGEHVIDGSAVRGGGNAHAGLSDVLIVGPSLHGATTVDARLSTGPVTSGIVEVDVMWTVGDEEYVLDAELVIQGMRIDSSECATAGSLSISGSVRRDNNVLREQTRALTFGPACGDLHVSP